MVTPIDRLELQRLIDDKDAQVVECYPSRNTPNLRSLAPSTSLWNRSKLAILKRDKPTVVY